MCETGPCENYESTANESYCLNDGVCSNVVSESQVAYVMSDSISDNVPRLTSRVMSPTQALSIASEASHAVSISV